LLQDGRIGFRSKMTLSDRIRLYRSLMLELTPNSLLAAIDWLSEWLILSDEISRNPTGIAELVGNDLGIGY